MSVNELLALIVGSGTSGASVEAVAEGVVNACRGSLRRLATLDVGLLESVRGIGAAGACRLVAALELGRRAVAEEIEPGKPIRGPRDVFELTSGRLRDLPQEEFHALLLNARHRVISEVLVTRGTLDASLIHAREVFRSAVTEGAAGVIVVHNHPSGDPTPSVEDRMVTRQLAEAGRALGIPLLDHVIVAGGRFRSLRSEIAGPETPRSAVHSGAGRRKHM